tara:strand:- start:170 stop:370 length:201 start_codon:yes stop_codon:yes gene_type:complete
MLNPMNTVQKRYNLIYEISSIIDDDPSTAPILIEELVNKLSTKKLDELEDVIVNEFGIEIYGEETV